MAWREVIKEQWVQGDFQSENVQETAAANAGAIEKADLCKKLAEMDFEEFNGLMHDE